MSTFLELQTEVLNHGFDSTAYRDRVQNWLNEALRRITRMLEIREAGNVTTITTTAGVASYVLPTNFIRLEALVDATTFDPLQRKPAADILDSTVTGRPSCFDIAAEGLLLWPYPDAAYNFSMRFWGALTALSADSDIPAIPADYHDLLVSYALSRAFRAEDDLEASTFYMSEFQRDLVIAGSDLQYKTTQPKQIPGTWSLPETNLD